MFKRAIQQASRGLRNSQPTIITPNNTFIHKPAAAIRLRNIPALTPPSSRRLYSTEGGKENSVPAGEVKVENGNGNGNGNDNQAQASAKTNGNGNGNGAGVAAAAANGNGNGKAEEFKKKADEFTATLEEVAKCKNDLEAKVKEAAELKDKFLRAVADFRNLQDRTEREVRAAKDYAIQAFAKDLVESVDNMDLALSAVPEEARNSPAEEKKDLVNLYNGLKMTETILLNTLKRHGLEKLNPLGDKFDPNLHEATFQAKVEGKEPGTVFHVQRTGFTLNGRVLRAAQVGVVQVA